MILSAENNDYSKDVHFKRFSSFLPGFKKKGKKEKNVNVKECELSKIEDEIEVDNKSMTQEPVESILQRVNKFKSEVYEKMLLLIYQDEQNFAEKSYILNHLKDAFCISEEKHKEILEKVEQLIQKELTAIKDDLCSSTESKSAIYISGEVDIYSIDVHCALLQIFLQYDLNYLNIQHYHWNGEYCNMVQKLLSLHAKAQNLDETHILYAKWIAYTEIHDIYPLNLKIFVELLNSLTEKALPERDDLSLAKNTIKLGSEKKLNVYSSFVSLVSLVSEYATIGITEVKAANIGKNHLKYVRDDVANVFWNSMENLVEIFLKFIRNLHFEAVDAENVNKIDILKEIFHIFDKIDSVSMPFYEHSFRFKECVMESLRRGITEHLIRNANQNLLMHGNRNDLRINELIRLIKLAQLHFFQFTSEYCEIFKSYLNVEFLEYIYKIYETELTAIIKPIVLNICKTKEGNIDNFASSHEVVAVKLFELYCELKKFADFGVEKFAKCDYDMSDYYSWFLEQITKCGKLSVFSILPRLERAIEADTLIPDKEENNFSSSATDLLELLDDIKKFWEYLKKTGSVEDYTKFIAVDIYRFTTKYFQKFFNKVENLIDVNNFDKATSNLSVVLANYNYILEKMFQFQIELTKDIEPDVIISVQYNIKFTFDYMETLINQLIIAVTKKYYTTIREKIITDSTVNESAISDNNNMEISSESEEYTKQILKLLPESAIREYGILRSELWNIIHKIIIDFVKDANHPPLFYSRLRVVFLKLKETLYGTDISSEIVKNTKSTEYYLECYEYNISRLIHEYYKERFIAQQSIDQEVDNSLTVNAFFSDNVLTLKITSRNKFFMSNKIDDSLITMSIIPKKYFPDQQKFKFKLSQNSFYPIKIQLTQEQRDMKDAIIYFRIDNKSYVWTKNLLGEAFLSFEKIPCDDLKNIEDINLMLNKLIKEDFKALEPIRKESEKGNKKAKKFLDKIKSQL